MKYTYPTWQWGSSCRQLRFDFAYIVKMFVCVWAGGWLVVRKGGKRELTSVALQAMPAYVMVCVCVCAVHGRYIIFFKPYTRILE